MLAKFSINGCGHHWIVLDDRCDTKCGSMHEKWCASLVGIHSKEYKEDLVINYSSKVFFALGFVDKVAT
jgi:hypothetical protein